MLELGETEKSAITRVRKSKATLPAQPGIAASANKVATQGKPRTRFDVVKGSQLVWWSIPVGDSTAVIPNTWTGKASYSGAGDATTPTE